jgi:predicted nucleic acid-binding protein
VPPVLLDTSVYITLLRAGSDAASLSSRVSGTAPIWLSSVVLEELHAGADSRARRALERLERNFVRARRILVPLHGDWTRAGIVLARLGQRYGYEEIGKGRLTNDALIAASAGRLGITILTANARDFGKLAEFQPFRWQVASL